MAIALEVEVIETQSWPQGDIRDPLGVWGFRLGVTGDASGGAIKVAAIVSADKAGAYVYTCYELTYAGLTGVLVALNIKSRLLTNWPNVDPIPAVQGFGSLYIATSAQADDFTAPVQGPQASHPLVQPQDRFMLLYDPRPAAGQIALAEIEINVNTNLATYSFEGYGYFWDRSVLQAPGGPRHPGSS